MIDCPECKNKIDEKVFYCPICGKKIKEKPMGTDFWPVATLFVLTIFLPPLNLGKSLKYIKSPDQKAQQIGWISIIVMVIIIILYTWWGIKWAQEVNRQVNLEMSRMLGF